MLQLRPHSFQAVSVYPVPTTLTGDFDIQTCCILKKVLIAVGLRIESHTLLTTRACEAVGRDAICCPAVK